MHLNKLYHITKVPKNRELKERRVFDQNKNLEDGMYAM